MESIYKKHYNKELNTRDIDHVYYWITIEEYLLQKNALRLEDYDN